MRNSKCGLAKWEHWAPANKSMYGLVLLVGEYCTKVETKKALKVLELLHGFIFLRISAIISVRTMSFDFHLFFPLGHSYLLFSPFGNVLKKHLFEN